MGYGTNLLHSHGHDAPPVVTWLNRILAQDCFIP
jgi:hypothetical protein